MDPYMEQPHLWPDFHDRLVTHLCEEIHAALPDRYYASVQDRIFLDEGSRWIVPDVRVSGSEPGPAPPVPPSCGPPLRTRSDDRD